MDATSTKEKKNSQQGNGLKNYQQMLRKKMCSRIKETITKMREDRTPISKKALAEELGVTEKALYADYVKQYLLQFVEFNPGLETVSENAEEENSNYETAKREMELMKLNFLEQKEKNRKLTDALEKEKKKNQALDKRYQHLLGAYQQECGSKIIPF